jgi:hypothetical protein
MLEVHPTNQSVQTQGHCTAKTLPDSSASAFSEMSAVKDPNKKLTQLFIALSDIWSRYKNNAVLREDLIVQPLLAQKIQQLAINSKIVSVGVSWHSATSLVNMQNIIWEELRHPPAFLRSSSFFFIG